MDGATVTGALTSDMISLITNAFNSLSATVTQVLTIAVPAIVGIICLSAGVNFALSKVRGVLGWA